MYRTLVVAAVALSGVSAALLPRQQSCCFQITASGGVPGTFTQLDDGQNRINDTGTPAQFCMNNGRILDSYGRGCIITPEANQFQCDLNRPPSPGFSVSSSGQLLHNGTSTFYACPATDTTYNIYNLPVPHQLKCRQISLSTSGSSGNCSGSGGFGPGTAGTGFSRPTGYGTAPYGAPTGSLPAGWQSAPTGFGPALIPTTGGPGTAPYLPTSGFGPAGGQSAPSGYGTAPYPAPSVYGPSGGQPAPSGYGTSAPYGVPSGSSPAVGQSTPTSAPSGYGPAGGRSGPTGYESGPYPTPGESTPVAGQSTPQTPNVGSTGAQSAPIPTSSGSSPAGGQSTPQTPGEAPSSATTPEVLSSILPESSSFTGSGPGGHSGAGLTPTTGGTSPSTPESTPADVPSSSGAACGYETVTVTFTQTMDCAACAYGSATSPSYGGGATSGAYPSSYGSTVAPNGTAPGGVPSPGFSAPGAGPTEFDSSYIPPVTGAPTESTSQPSAATTPSSNVAGQSNVPGEQSSPSSYGQNSPSPDSSYSPSTPADSSPSSAETPSGTTNGEKACPTSLVGAYRTPHLMIPISKDSPSTAYGTSYNGIINSTTSTIFNFDIPSSYAGKSCSIIFLFPGQGQLETSAYTLSGSGSLVFSELESAATESTSWDTVPKVSKALGSVKIEPGNSYVVRTESCKAGTTESIEVSSEGGLGLEFFEDWNPSSLGLYITSC